MEYREFIKNKFNDDVDSGFVSEDLNQSLFPFQRAIVDWACRRGRAAIFADVGLGKTLMQAEWSRQVCRFTGGNVLIFAPLCVAQQTVKESAKFGIDVCYVRNQEQVQSGVSVTNYEMLEHFEPERFAGIVLDESSILKSQTGKTREKLVTQCRNVPYRLSCTATPSPNDHIELGNQSDFLGILSAAEMLAMYFVHDGGSTQNWRLKGHGEQRFWEWMSTWSVCIKKPSDIGFDDKLYQLPPLRYFEHIVEWDRPIENELFPRPVSTLSDRRAIKRDTLDDRVGRVSNIVNSCNEPWIVWCHLNDESAALTQAIPDAVEVTGSMLIAEKERKIMAFTDGEARVLVTKPSIAGFGMNWQHCRNMVFSGIADSYESFYQAVSRCYRFGQERDVNVHLFFVEEEWPVRANLERKKDQAEAMQRGMVQHMAELTKQKIKGAAVERSVYRPKKYLKLPNWLVDNVEA